VLVMPNAYSSVGVRDAIAECGDTFCHNCAVQILDTSIINSLAVSSSSGNIAVISSAHSSMCIFFLAQTLSKVDIIGQVTRMEHL
jgi:hypothetical protein